MKQYQKDLLLAAVLGILVPWIALNWAVVHMDTTPNTSPPIITAPAKISMLNILNTDGTISPMPLEEYLTCVLLGEVPADFDPEALKAQAVVARTYALRSYESGTKHPGGAVCTQAECCQGYCSREDHLSRGGTEANYEKLRAAVAATENLVLTYDGKLIEATYFSSSGGRTEDALAVWGTDVPYLRSTDSPEDAYAHQSVVSTTFTATEFAQKLGISPEGTAADWFGAISYTPGGGVDTITIGGAAFKGTQVRRLLGLRSTAFTLTAIGDHITITTKGYGHRVGMSQYGAEAMAVSGCDFRQILAHYYQGTTLEQWIDKERKVE